MASKPTIEDSSISVAKTPAELQRMRLEKLMKNPAKQVVIPEKSKPPKMKEAPEFIRNVWGSSAGAGSGDFHVYRGVRRREYARQKFNAEKSKQEELDAEYQKSLEEHKKAAEERTAKKRAKRQKKKGKMKSKKLKKGSSGDETRYSNSDDDKDALMSSTNKENGNENRTSTSDTDSIGTECK